jgi:hypothetical protein
MSELGKKVVFFLSERKEYVVAKRREVFDTPLWRRVDRLLP